MDLNEKLKHTLSKLEELLHFVNQVLQLGTKRSESPIHVNLVKFQDMILFIKYLLKQQLNGVKALCDKGIAN